MFQTLKKILNVQNLGCRMPMNKCTHTNPSETQNMISKNFVVGGNSIFTIEIPASYGEANQLKPHYTFRVRKPKNAENEIFFVQILTGPDNTSSYTYLGVLDKETGFVRTTQKSSFHQNDLIVRLLNRTLNLIWAENTQSINDAGFEIHHEGRCGRCGRVLTVPESITSGFGPECSGRVA